jgi:hypothetical protein
MRRRQACAASGTFRSASIWLLAGNRMFIIKIIGLFQLSVTSG